MQLINTFMRVPPLDIIMPMQIIITLTGDIALLIFLQSKLKNC